MARFAGLSLGMTCGHLALLGSDLQRFWLPEDLHSRTSHCAPAAHVDLAPANKLTLLVAVIAFADSERTLLLLLMIFVVICSCFVCASTTAELLLADASHVQLLKRLIRGIPLPHCCSPLRRFRTSVCRTLAEVPGIAPVSRMTYGLRCRSTTSNSIQSGFRFLSSRRRVSMLLSQCAVSRKEARVYTASPPWR